MIKQPYRHKVVKQQKKRINLIKLEQRIEALERAFTQQQRMNNHINSSHQIVNLANESLLERVERLEQLHYQPTFLGWLFSKLAK